MNHNLLHNLLRFQLFKGVYVDIGVEGISMEPTLFKGDVVTVQRADTYEVGDILVFLYKNNDLLVHRLLCVKGKRYFCKGDNAFRLEDIDASQIFGKVVKINGKKAEIFNETKIKLSYLVSVVFRSTGYQIDKTKESAIYRFYQQYLNKIEDSTINYQRNKDIDILSLNNRSFATFNCENSNICFFDKLGIDILNYLEQPSTLDSLLSKLRETYGAALIDIRFYVEEFIAECVAKKIVNVL